jgi:DNA-binding MarR family transcriptional regulator
MDKKIDIIIKLYLLSRLIKAKTKSHNRDKMLTLTILFLLKNNVTTVTELSKQIGTKVSSLSEKVKQLELENLIVKIESRDSRENLLKITDKGKHLLKNVFQKMIESKVGQTIDLDSNEQKLLLKLLSKIKPEKYNSI